jgi:hypothetical protein
MEFVSKQQAYEGLRKLMLTEAAQTGNARLEDLARNMQMQGDHSAHPELYQRYLDTIKSDPLSPQNALAAGADFLETNFPDGSLARDARAAAGDPESEPAFWNRWIGILESI